ncbi:MAG: hypothetical protein PHI93_10335 [Kiritimatiellae bacterium]|nr:hypothetical protein [Kiritimatiellia bacterium]
MAVIILAGIFVLLAIVIVHLICQSRRDQNYIGQLHRASRSMAVTLHREHHAHEPASLHVLWWKSPDSQIPGVTFHTIHRQAPWQKDAAGLDVFTRDYNYVTLGQASHLALQGEDSPRVRAVLKIAEQSYTTSSEADLLGLMEALRKGDPAAKAKFEEVFKWASRSFFPNRRYFEEDLMPTVAKWGTTGDHNKSMQATPDGAPDP